MRSENGAAGVPNRRQWTRVAIALPVDYQVEGADTWQNGRSADLGGGGIRLGTTEDLPLGSNLLLRFRLTGSDRDLLARGRIVLSFFNGEEKRFYHGIAFAQIDPRDQEAIVSFVATELKRRAQEPATD